MIREKEGEHHVSWDQCCHEQGAHEYDVEPASSLVGDVGRDRAGVAEEIRRALRRQRRQTSLRQRKLELLGKLYREVEVTEIHAGTTEDNNLGWARHGGGAKSLERVRKRGAADTTAPPAAKQMRNGVISSQPPNALASPDTSKHTIAISSRDVLVGRGKHCAGNVTFRKLVSRSKGLYSIACKSDKIEISKAIVSAVRESGGRFLEERGDGTYVDIGDKWAWALTSQELRKRQVRVRACLKADAEGQARVEKYKRIIAEQAVGSCLRSVLEGLHNEQEQRTPIEVLPSLKFSASDHNEASGGASRSLTPESQPVVPEANGLQDETVLLKLNQLERQFNILLAQSRTQTADILRLKRHVEKQAKEISRLRKNELERGAQNAYVEPETTWF